MTRRSFSKRLLAAAAGFVLARTPFVGGNPVAAELNSMPPDQMIWVMGGVDPETFRLTLECITVEEYEYRCEKAHWARAAKRSFRSWAEDNPY